MNKVKALFSKLGLSLQIFKTAVAASIAWVIAIHIFHAEYPYFAPLAAILTVQVTVADSVQKAAQRIIGVIGGVLVSLLISHWFTISALSIFLVIIIGMAIASALRMNAQIISQVAESSFSITVFP